MDAKGYHSADLVDGASDQTSISERNSDTEYHITSSKRRSLSPSRTPQASSCVLSFNAHVDFSLTLLADTPTSSKLQNSPQTEDVDHLGSSQSQRATSEPPPDLDEHQDARDETIGIPVQEYSWEWGAFPQPSPMKTSFGKARFDTAKMKSKARLEPLDPKDDIDLQLNIDEESPAAILRSQSVPPELDGSPSLKRRELPASDAQEEGLGQDAGCFGAGGRLTSSRSDPTWFRVHIEGKTVSFELSIIDPDEWTKGKVFEGTDEVNAAALFEKGKVDYRTFLDDESVVRDRRLVIRWVDGQ